MIRYLAFSLLLWFLIFRVQCRFTNDDEKKLAKSIIEEAIDSLFSATTSKSNENADIAYNFNNRKDEIARNDDIETSDKKKNNDDGEKLEEEKFDKMKDHPPLDDLVNKVKSLFANKDNNRD